VVQDVVQDATEDIHQVPGITSKDLVLSLDGFTKIPNIAHHISSPHVITTPPENMDHAEPVNQHQNAIELVLMVLHSKLINGLPIPFTEFHLKLTKSKLKS